MSATEMMSSGTSCGVVMDPKNCVHEACTCPALAGKDYCGSYCETARDQHQAGDGCGCGHPECAPN